MLLPAVAKKCFTTISPPPHGEYEIVGSRAKYPDIRRRDAREQQRVDVSSCYFVDDQVDVAAA